jgi:hypothetical protein
LHIVEVAAVADRSRGRVAGGCGLFGGQLVEHWIRKALLFSTDLL